jgi:CheY-like chemotaxis protein
MGADFEVVETKKRVLVIDDDADVRDIYRSVLERAGYRVSIAANGREGLEKALKELPHLVLLDIVFLPPQPEQPDGFAVLQSMQDEPATENIPVIILTGPRDDPKHAQTGLSLGATAYLIKHRTGPKKILAVCREALAPEPPAVE